MMRTLVVSIFVTMMGCGSAANPPDAQCVAERCDGEDNDCDGQIDEGFTVGTPCMLSNGACRAEGATACRADGEATECVALPNSPAQERCNGIDDDCDGEIDEGFTVGTPCALGEGACRAEGTMACRADGEVTECIAFPGSPARERCNGIDDDCDGEVDEGFGLGTTCTAGVGGCARSGTLVCDVASGTAICDVEVGSPAAESCNGVDDDCDGQVDEGFGVGFGCDVGVGACARFGVMVCDGPQATRCDAMPGAPQAELCNGIDDDCDGAIDDDAAGLGDECVASAPGSCAHGHRVCSAGHLACAPGAPEPEACNGVDDDCDGQSDEGFGLGAACDVGVGACRRTGATVCDGPQATRCGATPGAPSPESCNGADDDCNSVVDDVAGIGDDCVANAPGVCAQGHLLCSFGGLVCASSSGQTEMCNGLDDDCDGQVDEEDARIGMSCTTGEPGVCSPGTFVCTAGGELVCERTAQPGAESCNGIDDDCDGAIDDGCLPADTVARFPGNGVLTGSPWIPAGMPSAPLRPRFGWDAVAGAEHYEIEIDDSCAAATFHSCGFPSPEIRAAVAGTSFRPTEPLSVALTPPVGRRYYWRVRACNGPVCSAFTGARYLDVGRTAGDLNGDGYADLLVGGASAGFVFAGGPTGASLLPTSSIRPPNAALFIMPRGVGDLNADGFADVCIGHTDANGGRGAAYIYYGAAGGPPTQPSLILPNPTFGTSGFGIHCFGPGDVDGDGDADLIISRDAPEEVQLYLGDPGGLAATSSVRLPDPMPARLDTTSFGVTGAGLGDIDGDGYADFAIGAPFARNLFAPFVPAPVFIYRGGPFGPAPTPSQAISNRFDPLKVLFGMHITGNQDIDGDGVADAVFGSGPDGGTPFPNPVFVYRGSASGLVDPASETVLGPPLREITFAAAVALGDVNGDGNVDLLSGDPRSNVADLLLGSSGRLAPSSVVSMQSPVAGAQFADRVGLCDLDSDGFDERVIGLIIHPGMFEEAYVYIYAGSAAPTTVPGPPLRRDADGFDLHLHGDLSCGK